MDVLFLSEQRYLGYELYTVTAGIFFTGYPAFAGWESPTA